MSGMGKAVTGCFALLVSAALAGPAVGSVGAVAAHAAAFQDNDPQDTEADPRQPVPKTQGAPGRGEPADPPAPPADSGPPWPFNQLGPFEPVQPQVDPPYPEPEESSLDEIDDGVGGDLTYTNYTLDKVKEEFNRRARECDLEVFLAARDRYLAELDAVLRRKNLDANQRKQLTRVRDAVAAMKAPAGAPCPDLRPRLR